MCIAVPMKVVKIEGDKGVAEIGGIEREVGLQLMEDIKLGDYVIVHAGFAIQIVEKEEALATQGYWKEWLDAQED